MRINIRFEDRTYVLEYEDLFESGISLDEYLKIDYGNIEGELITFPLVQGKIGLLMSEMEKDVKYAKMALELKEAELSDRIRNIEGNEKLSDAKLSAKVKMEKDYSDLRNKLIEKEYDLSVIEKVYWAAREKSNKLDRLHTPKEESEDFLQKQVNNISIRRKSLFN